MSIVKHGVTILLEFSEDDLSVSNAAATYTDVSDYFISADWGYGTRNELDFADAGDITLVVGKQGSRDFEPGYTAGAFYPNVVPLRRFRLSLNGTKQGVWFAKSYTPSWPDSLNYEAVTIRCVDGFGILSLEELDAMDPPDALSYADVVNYDEPAFYYRLGEPEGTKLVSHIRSKKWQRRHPNRSKKYKTVETRAELGGVSGSSGTYKNTPTLGVPGLILGDTNTAVSFTAAQSEYARVELDQSDAIDGNRLSVECWVKMTTLAAQHFVSGPWNASASAPVFSLSGGNTIQFNVQGTGGASLTVSTDRDAEGNIFAVGTIYHVVGTWDGQTARLYINSSERDVDTTSLTLRQGDAGGFLYIGQNANGASFADAVIDEPAVYERALSPERVEAHYLAGSARGFAQDVAGDRVAEIVTHDLWAETEIQAGAMQVVPRFKFGQSKVEELDNTASSELPDGLTYFNGDGNPVYLGWDYRSGGTYPTTQVTLAVPPTGSEVAYSGITPQYDDEIFNHIMVSTEDSGQHIAEDMVSMDAYRIRHHTETGLPLHNEGDADTIAARLLDIFSQPRWRVEDVTVTANTAFPNRLAAILGLEIGELVRVKHRVLGGSAIDIVTNILGVRKSLSRDGVLSATWSLARGFDGSVSAWRLGITGFTELGETAVLG